ncbi:hypothetical protein N8940_02290 [Sphingomonadaceae bacterium]|nr:hypothetical protein [Sphingomonadaceae bacterium]
MDADLFLIFSFILILVSIAMGVGTSIQKRSNEHEERKLELQARIAEAEAGKIAKPDSRLEDRVRVLERLATDRGVSLADEIESLRTESPALNDHREKETQQ